MDKILPGLQREGARLRHAGDSLAPWRTLTLAQHVWLLSIAAAAFLLYFYSAQLLNARQAPQYFGADSWWYAKLAHGEVIDRVARFHPVTVALALAWMKALAPVADWLSQGTVLDALFCFVGAVGVWAATWAFSAVLPFRQAICWGLIYAASFGIWFFSSIDESKILTATFASLYIAVYLHLRQRRTVGGVLLLTAVLLVACLNEIVSGFLVAVPLVDTLLRRGWHWRHHIWIVLHAMAGPVALLLLELVVNGLIIARTHDPEGASHLVMFFHYFTKADHSLASLYAFTINWLFFNLAAPTADAPFGFAGDPNHGHYFNPSFGGYFLAPVSAGAAVLLLAVAALAIWSRYRVTPRPAVAGLVAALAVYALLRATFFFLFNPFEPLLFSSATTLAHLLIVAIPLSAAQVPRQELLLGTVVVVLLATNGRFFVG